MTFSVGPDLQVPQGFAGVRRIWLLKGAVSERLVILLQRRVLPGPYVRSGGRVVGDIWCQKQSHWEIFCHGKYNGWSVNFLAVSLPLRVS